MAWLPLTSTTVAPARLDMARWASGGIILSPVVSRYQLGFVLHAGSLIAPLMGPMPHGTWESAMNAAFSGSTSAALSVSAALSRKRRPLPPYLLADFVSVVASSGFFHNSP